MMGVVKMLRITGCTDSSMWYADMVGQLVPLDILQGRPYYTSVQPPKGRG